MNLKLIVLIQSFLGVISAISVPNIGQIEAANLAANNEYYEDINFSDDLISVFEEALSEEQLEIIDEFNYQLQHTLYADNGGISRRDLESNIESIIRLVNSSGLLWDALDYAVDHPNIVGFLANTTGGILGNAVNGGGNSTALVSFLTGTISGANVSAIGNIALKSGLVQQVLDGVLLEEKYRKDVSRIIYQVAESNIGIITILLRNLLAPANQNSKRANGGSLTEFVGNLVGGLLNSNLFFNGLESVVNALNDTRFVTYTVQRFIDNEEYVNMTGDLLKQSLSAADINLSDLSGSLNLTSLVESALSDTSRITDLIGGVLSGDLSGVSKFLRRYVPGVRGIIRDLEDEGLFVQLNNAVFPSSSKSGGKAVQTGKSKEQNVTDIATASDNGASNKGIWTGLMAVQGLVTILFFV